MARDLRAALVRRARGLLCRLALHAPPLVRLLPARQPLLSERHAAAGRRTEPDLLVLLPGISDSPADFVRWGFIDTLRQYDCAMDVVAVDAHYGYYARETVLERLHHDVIRPARHDYRRVWLAGISLGGFGALYYASRYETDVTGVIALAPFLGHEPMVTEIERAGGLRAWPRPDDSADHVRRLWSWLKRYEEPAQPLPSLVLAYGARDRFARAHGLLSEVLPAGSTFRIAGGHDWPTWVRLWERLVIAGVLPSPGDDASI